MSRTAALLVLVASAAAAEEPGLSLVGSGLLTLPSTATLERGRARVGITTDNRDRDPLGLDVLDYELAFTVGVRARFEVYGHVVVSRVVAVPELPALPPPPLDVIVPAGAAAPPRPYYSLYFPIPYVNKRGTARFSDLVPGDAVLGGKWRLVEAAGSRPALAASLEIKLPLTRELGSLQSGAGTGAVDCTGRLTGERPLGRTSVVASLAYTRVGTPALGDRWISADGSTTELPLELPDRVDLGLGLRRPLSPHFALVAEAATVFEVGPRTPTVDAARPVDGLAGVQWRGGRARITFGVRYHGHSLPSGAVRPSPLAGLVDLTDVAAADLQGYLRRIAAAGAIDQLRPGSQRLLAAAAGGVPLPSGARRIPPTYRIRSEHQVGFVVALGWAF